MKIGLYSITYLGIWYKGSALSFKEFVIRAKKFGYDGVELDGKRPHGNPMDLDSNTRKLMRQILADEGLEIVGVAANNDFSSPIPEHRECQLLMVREITRLAADLGAKTVRLFAAWPGIIIRNGIATYDLVRGDYYTFERPYPSTTRLERWEFVKDCLGEAANFGKEYGIVMVLQNHEPLIRHWKDCYDFVKEIDSPWLKVCLDLPCMTCFEKDFIQKAVYTVGDLQALTHFGGEFFRDNQGKVQLKEEFNKPIPDYPHFVKLLADIGYDGYLSYELCHPLLDANHQPYGIDYVDQQTLLAQEFMKNLI